MSAQATHVPLSVNPYVHIDMLRDILPANHGALHKCRRPGEIKILSKILHIGLKICPQRGRGCQTKRKFSGHPLWITLCVILKMFYDMKFAFHIHKILTVSQRVLIFRPSCIDS